MNPPPSPSHTGARVASSPDGAARVSLQSRAYAWIRHRILMGVLVAGAPLSEESIATELAMSRTPVRQAFLELAAQGLVERVPGRGVAVARVDLRKMLDIVELQQCLLEWCVVRLCERTDLDVGPIVDAWERQHRGIDDGEPLQVLFDARTMDIAIVSISGNQEMVRHMKEISDLLIHAASQALSTPWKFAEAVEEHAAIVEALRHRDGAAALRAVRRHGLGIRRRLTSGSG